MTGWRDKEAFEAWVASPAFAHGHRGVRGRRGSSTRGGPQRAVVV